MAINLRATRNDLAFTIVELLVVIVVIAILAAITIVSYTGISSKAVSSALQSDLSNAKKQLALYQVDHSAYPTSPLTITGNTYCPSDDTKYCFKASSTNSFPGYSASNSSNPQSFLLIASNSPTSNSNSLVYKVTNTTAPTQVLANMQPGVTPGAILELNASKANGGTTPGINSPLTTTWADTSGNGNNGTLTNFAGTTASGWAGTGTIGDPYSAVFDGVNDRVATTVSDMNSHNITLEAWVKLTAVNSSKGVLILGAMGGLFDWYSGYLDALVWGVGTPDYRAVHIAVAMNDNSLHHIVATIGPQYMRSYRDGVYKGQVDIVNGFSINDAGSIVELGSRQGAAWWNGALPLARVYPFILSDSQVAQNYNVGPN